MTTEAQKRAKKKYNQKNVFNKTIQFNRSTESDLIEWMSDKTFGAYVKELIKKALLFYT